MFLIYRFTYILQIGQERPLTEENILDVAGYFFISLTFLGFTVLFSSIFTFPVEKEIMLKERKSGMYRLSSYYCATMITDVPLALLYPLLYVVISYWMAGLKKSADFVLFILVIFLDVLVAQSVGLDIGALFLNLQKAQVAAALFTFFNMVRINHFVWAVKERTTPLGGQKEEVCLIYNLTCKWKIWFAIHYFEPRLPLGSL